VGQEPFNPVGPKAGVLRGGVVGSKNSGGEGANSPRLPTTPTPPALPSVKVGTDVHRALISARRVLNEWAYETISAHIRQLMAEISALKKELEDERCPDQSTETNQPL